MAKRINKHKVAIVGAHKQIKDAITHFNGLAAALEEADGIMEAARHIDRGRPRKCYCGTCSKCKSSARAKRYRESLKKKDNGFHGQRVSGSADWLRGY